MKTIVLKQKYEFRHYFLKKKIISNWNKRIISLVTDNLCIHMCECVCISALFMGNSTVFPLMKYQCEDNEHSTSASTSLMCIMPLLFKRSKAGKPTCGKMYERVRYSFSSCPPPQKKSQIFIRIMIIHFQAFILSSGIRGLLKCPCLWSFVHELSLRL